jgi:hypothetical protein
VTLAAGAFGISHKKYQKSGLLEEFWGPFKFCMYGMLQEAFNLRPPLLQITPKKTSEKFSKNLQKPITKIECIFT